MTIGPAADGTTLRSRRRLLRELRARDAGKRAGRPVTAGLSSRKRAAPHCAIGPLYRGRSRNRRRPAGGTARLRLGGCSQAARLSRGSQEPPALTAPAAGRYGRYGRVRAHYAVGAIGPDRACRWRQRHNKQRPQPARSAVTTVADITVVTKATASPGALNTSRSTGADRAIDTDGTFLPDERQRRAERAKHACAIYPAAPCPGARSGSPPD